MEDVRRYRVSPWLGMIFEGFMLIGYGSIPSYDNQKNLYLIFDGSLFITAACLFLLWEKLRARMVRRPLFLICFSGVLGATIIGASGTFIIGLTGAFFLSSTVNLGIDFFWQWVLIWFIVGLIAGALAGVRYFFKNQYLAYEKCGARHPIAIVQETLRVTHNFVCPSCGNFLTWQARARLHLVP